MAQPEDQIVSEYETHGVTCVRQMFDAGMMERVKEALARYEREVVPGLPGKDVVFEADAKSIRNLWRMEHHDDFFAKLAQQPTLLALVSRLVRSRPVLLGVETFNKPAKVGSGIPPHQDNAYFCRLPADVLTVWIAVDPVTHANGPVHYVPGSHKLGMLPHKPSGVKGNSMGLAQPWDRTHVFTRTLEPGDALIHHCQTIHYSSANGTDHPRCGLLMVYRAEHAAQSPQLQAQYAAGGAAV